MAWPCLLTRQILDIRESICGVTIFLAIIINVGPFVLYLSLSVLAGLRLDIKVTLVTRTSRLAGRLTDRTFSRVMAFRTCLAIEIISLFINIEELICCA